MMKKYIAILFISVFLFSCEKEDFDIENLNGNTIIVFGHGGMGVSSLYPMNSYESIMECLMLGVDGTEMDVQMTRDSVLVLFHDTDLSERTTGKGWINSLNWEDIKDLRYNESLYLNYSIISLEELFSNLKNVHKYLFTFDCKLYTQSNDRGSFYNTFINKLIEIIEKYHLEENILIESQDVDFLKEIQTRKPSYKLFIYPSEFQQGYDIAMVQNFYGITISTEDITKAQVAQAHNSGLFVTIWGINSTEANRDAIKKNPDFIQTDDLESLLYLLED